MTDVLMAQVQPSDAYELAALAHGPGSGLVISGDREARLIARYLHGHGYRQPILPDRERYKGRRRLPASQPFDPNWIAWQRDLGLPIIVPDAGYIADGDLQGLRSVLHNSAAISGAIAPLALANSWLYGAGLRLLLSELDASPRVPIAVVIEHGKDPFSAHRVLDGLLAVIRTGIPTVPLRCDISTIGLIAHGALGAAYGSTSALRHLYPVRNGGGGNGPSRESAVWPSGMAMHYRDSLYDAVHASPADIRWLCSCEICRGGRLDRLATAELFEVRKHNFASTLALRHALVRQPRGRDRAAMWTSWCRSGLQVHASVDTGNVALPAPKALQHWVHADRS